MLENEFKVELLPNNFYIYKSNFKPEKTLMLKKHDRFISIAFTRDMFTIPESVNAERLVNELKQKLVSEGFTYVH